ncbi:hypothetical protein MMPV_002059 [Pyropia vietnamensis]
MNFDLNLTGAGLELPSPPPGSSAAAAGAVKGTWKARRQAVKAARKAVVARAPPSPGLTGATAATKAAAAAAVAAGTAAAAASPPPGALAAARAAAAGPAPVSILRGGGRPSAAGRSPARTVRVGGETGATPTRVPSMLSPSAGTPAVAAATRPTTAIQLRPTNPLGGAAAAIPLPPGDRPPLLRRRTAKGAGVGEGTGGASSATPATTGAAAVSRPPLVRRGGASTAGPTAVVEAPAAVPAATAVPLVDAASQPPQPTTLTTRKRRALDGDALATTASGVADDRPRKRPMAATHLPAPLLSVATATPPPSAAAALAPRATARQRTRFGTAGDAAALPPPPPPGTTAVAPSPPSLSPPSSSPPPPPPPPPLADLDGAAEATATGGAVAAVDGGGGGGSNGSRSRRRVRSASPDPDGEHGAVLAAATAALVRPAPTTAFGGGDRAAAGGASLPAGTAAATGVARVGATGDAALFSPGTAFDAIGLWPSLVRHVTLRMGLTAPTRVQVAVAAALIPGGRAAAEVAAADTAAPGGSPREAAGTPAATTVATNCTAMDVDGLAPSTASANGVKEDGGGAAATAASATVTSAAPRDVLVRSPTGTGKTLAYLLPIAHSLLTHRRQLTRADGTIALVVVPTRELAAQVAAAAAALLRPYHWLVVGSVTGGESRKAEKARLRKGITLLVTTPGRLVDHLRGTVSFRYDGVRFLVVDEADRVLDGGFEDDVREVLRSLDHSSAGKRANVLLSATLTSDVQRLARDALRDPLLVALDASAGDVEMPGGGAGGGGGGGSKGGAATAAAKGGAAATVSDGSKAVARRFDLPAGLRHHYCLVEQKYRLLSLVAILRARTLTVSKALAEAAATASASADGEARAPPPAVRIMVFFSSCASVDFHYALFTKAVLPAELAPTDGGDGGQPVPLLPVPVHRLHGNLPQAARVRSLAAFRAAPAAVLLCSDVAARGLDVPDVALTVQYDPPTGGSGVGGVSGVGAGGGSSDTGELADYVHRVGRGGRLGVAADSLLFLLPAERAYVGALAEAGVLLVQVSADAAVASLAPPHYRPTTVGGGGGASDDAADAARRVRQAARKVTAALQPALEAAVSGSARLSAAATDGYRAYCRAYATHGRDVRHIFHVRSLHLGHVARAFALAAGPGAVGAGGKAAAAARGGRMGGKDDDDGAASSDSGHDSDRGVGAGIAWRGEGGRRVVSSRRVTGGGGGRPRPPSTAGAAEVARAIAAGGAQPYNDPSTTLARRRRDGGRGREALKEIASEFAS